VLREVLQTEKNMRLSAEAGMMLSWKKQKDGAERKSFRN
jgi:hypothetical protein